MLALAHGGHSAFAFLRTLCAARLLGVEEFGIAASYAILVAAAEALTGFGIPQYLLRAPNGDSPRLQARLHLIQGLKGILAALVLFLLAPTIATALSLENQTTAFRYLSLTPLLLGVQNLDMIRRQRDGDFEPLARCHILAGCVGLAGLFVGFVVFPDPRAVLVAIILQSGAACIASHTLSERPYRVGWQAQTTQDVLRFGAPLLANGILLFFVLHGEKLVIARLGTLEMLGLFTLGLTISVMPSAVLDKSVQAYFLPRLAAVHTENVRLRDRTQTLAWIGTWLGVGLVGTLACLAPASAALFGAEFAPLTGLLYLFGILAGMRLMRSAVVTTAIALGHTSVAPFSNLPRLISLLGAVILLSNGGSIGHLLYLAVAFEGAGLGLSLLLLHRRTPSLAQLFLRPGTVFVAAAGLASLAPGLTTLAAVSGIIIWRLKSSPTVRFLQPEAQAHRPSA